MFRGVLIAAGGLLAAVTAHEVIVTAVPEHDPVDVSALPPATTPVPPEQHETSQLPLTLLGTLAASEPSLSRATLRQRESQETLVVGVGDEIEGARVEQIERARVLLRYNGSIRELRLDAEHAPSGASVATSEGSGVPVPAATENPLQNPGRGSFEALLADLERSMRESMSGQARVLPELEGEQMIGLHVSAIQEGSRLAQIGIEDDDVITQFNGVSIDSPFLALHAVRELLDSDGYHVTVRRGDELEQLPGRQDDTDSIR